MTTIERLRALLAEATPGPWKAWLREDDPWGRRGTVVGVEHPASDPDVAHGHFAATGMSDLDREDAALIAAAVNALPALLDVAEAAREYRTNQSIAARDALDAALDRLEGAL